MTKMASAPQTQTQTPIAARLWQQAQCKAFQSLYHPFVASLAAGTLAKEDFQAFLLQDAYYLNAFAKAFAFAATKTTASEHTLQLIRRMGGIEEELRTHTAFLKSFGIDLFLVDDLTVAPATHQYVNFLLTTAKRSETVAEILASMTPCIRLYAFLGESIAAAAKTVQPSQPNPYQLWIDTYSTPEFSVAARDAEHELSAMAAFEGVAYETLLPLYNTAMELELRFFEQNFPMARAAAFFPPATLPFPLTIHVTIDEASELLESEVNTGGGTAAWAATYMCMCLSLRAGQTTTAAAYPSDSINGIEVASLKAGSYAVCIDKPDGQHNAISVSPAAAEPQDAAVALLATLLSSSSSSTAFTHSKAELTTFLKTLAANGSFAAYSSPVFEYAKHVPRVLTIAGSDSGGGAGIQADMKACTNLGVFSTSAVTAVTVQNTLGVHSIHAIPVKEIADQITCVLDDIGTDVVKTGMLATEEIIETVATLLEPRNLPLVMDPVMVATSGDRLLKEAAHRSMVEKLFPLATIITPNIPETSVLLDDRVIETIEDMKIAASDLAAFGPKYVLVKGGHLPTPHSDCVHDVLLDVRRHEFHIITNAKLETRNTHGTGCTLAAAIAAQFAKKHDMVAAVKTAIAYLHGVLQESQSLAIGTGDNRPMLHVA